jgi:hypothetical protein
MRKEIQDYLNVRTANATGFTVEQVRTLNRCEDEHNRAYAAECRAAQRGEPVFPRVEEFKVEFDKRLGLPRVTYFDTDEGWMRNEYAVRKDGSLDRTL